MVTGRLVRVALTSIHNRYTAQEPMNMKTSLSKKGQAFLQEYPIFFTTDGDLYTSYTDGNALADDDDEYIIVAKGDSHGAVIDV